MSRLVNVGKKEIRTVTNDLKDLENELSDTKLKLLRLEYDFTELENREEFSTRDSIVIRNAYVREDGDDH